MSKIYSRKHSIIVIVVAYSSSFPRGNVKTSVLIKTDETGQFNICGWWKFKDDGSVKFLWINYLEFKCKHQKHNFDDGYPIDEDAQFRFVKTKKGIWQYTNLQNYQLTQLVWI